MAGVVADSVIVLVEARTREYEAAMERAAQKTKNVIDRLRATTNSPIRLGSNVSADTSAVARIIASRKAIADAERTAARVVATSVASSISARNREAAAATAAANRIVRARAMAGTSLGSGRPAMPPVSAYNAVTRAIREALRLQTELNVVTGAISPLLQQQIVFLRTINRLRRAGVTDTRAVEAAERRVLEILRQQANARGRGRPPGPGPTPPPGPGPSGGPQGGQGGTTVFGGLRSGAATFLGAYAGIQGAQEYLALTDAFKQYNAQLKLATMESGNLAVAQADVLRIAQTTRSGIGETAQLYATFQRNAAQLGLTQQESAQATDVITKSFKISGATAAEAAGGLRQFLQGLQSGTLRGEEFNSIVENAPRLAKIFADQLAGGNVGALRALAGEGKITGEEIKKALADPAVYAQINKEFEQLPVTFEDAMTVVRNAATVTFGAFDQGGEFSKALASFFLQGADGFTGMATNAEQTGIQIRSEFAGLYDAFAPLVQGALEAFNLINAKAQSSSEYVRGFLQTLDTVYNFTATPTNAISRFFGGPVATSNLAGRYSAGQRQSEDRGQTLALERRIDAMFGNYARDRGSRDIFGNPTRRVAPKVNADIQKYQEQIADLEKLKVGASGKELTNINKQIARRQKIVDNLNKGVGIEAARAGAVGLGGSGRKGPSAETLQRRAEAAEAKRVRQEDAYNSEVERLNSAIVSAKGKQAEGIEETYKAALDNADAELRERQVKFQNLENEKKIDDAKRKVLVGLAQQVNAQQKLTAATERAAALADDALQLQAGIASNRVDTLRAQIDMEPSRARRQKLEDELITKEYEARRAELAGRYQRALPGSAESLTIEGQLAGLDGQEAADRYRASEDRKGTYQRYRENLTNADSLSAEIENIQVGILDSVADSLADATTNALGLSGALGDIASQIIKIGIQRAIIGPIADALFGAATGGGGGGLLGGFFSRLGGTRASGGDVSAGRLYRINENGPEFFQPAMSGKIIPTGRAASANGGGVTVVQHISVDGRNSVTPATFAADILGRANQYANQAAARAGQSAYNASPQRQQKINQLGS